MVAAASRWLVDSAEPPAGYKKSLSGGYVSLGDGRRSMGGRIRIHRKGYEYNIHSKSPINQIILKILRPIWNEGIAILFGDEEK